MIPAQWNPSEYLASDRPLPVVIKPVSMNGGSQIFFLDRAEQVATIQTLLTTFKLQNVNPYNYLVDVLLRINLHPARDVTELTPRCWKDKFEGAPLLSDLARLGK